MIDPSPWNGSDWKMVNGLGFGTDYMDVCFILWFFLTRFRSRARFPEGLTLSIVTAIAETAQNLFSTTLTILVRFCPHTVCGGGVSRNCDKGRKD